MKRHFAVVFLAVSVLCLAALVQAQDTYQQGTIVKVQKLASTSPGGGTDAALQPSLDRYDISVQIGDTIYVCRYKVVEGEDLSWISGKEVQAKVKGKVIYVKRASGKDAKASILHTTKAATP